MKEQITKGLRTYGVAIFIGFVVLCIYIIIALYYGKCFFPNTTINGNDFGQATEVETRAILRTQLQDYSLDVRGRDLETGENTSLLVISARDVKLLTDIDGKEVKDLLKKQNNFLWPVYIWGTYEYQLQGGQSFDAEELTNLLNEQDIFKDECTTLPKDAYIKGYSATTGEYEVVEAVEGTRLNREVAEAAINKAITDGKSIINLETENCYLEPKVTTKDASMQAVVDKASLMKESVITYDWNGNKVVVNGEQIQEWVVLKDGKFTLDETLVRAFVEENAQKYDTYGKNRVFHTTLGHDLTLPSGSFGWLTDYEAETKALIDLIEDGAVTEREPIYASKAPWKGTNDIGNSYVEADLTHQHLYLYQNGVLTLETDFVSGDMSKGYNTPQGVFGITYKTTNAVLRGADYQENVSYWMPYEGNYGMHDSSWRDTFGGDIFMTNGSHGCLNLPVDMAGAIYGQVTEGFPVICYYYPEGVLTPQEPVYEEEVYEEEEE